jgi:anti-sigma regulatory factor (Ser/Thr protein kinase)
VTIRAHGEFVHQAAIYASDEQLLHVVVPHVEEGLAVGDAVVVAVADDQAELIRAALPGPMPGLTFTRGLHHTRPPATIKEMRERGHAHGSSRAGHLRVVSTVPQPGLGAPWDGWCRYEAALNDLLDGVPLWSLCLYDRRITPEPVLADVLRTHPFLAGAEGGRQPNDQYQTPRAFLAALASAPNDPLESLPPAIELRDPSPATARRAVHELAPRTNLRLEEVDDFLVATSEAVSNAILHGTPPVRLRLWTAPDRMVVAVTDFGLGPRHLHAGLAPPTEGSRGAGGIGLWLIHQMTAAATCTRGPDGFTLHLVAGNAPPIYHPRS